MITPGPWKIAAHCSTLIFDTKGRSIASAGGYQSNTESTIDENEANANLIVAAPDLLEALEEIREVWAGSDGFIPETATEGYQQRLLKQMYQIAVDALKGVNHE